MKGFLDLPYRMPFVRHYRAFDRGFYSDFPRQLALMGGRLRQAGCRRTLDIGAMTGGCIEYLSRLGIRMDGVQFTEDIRRLAAARLRKAGIRSRLFVSPVHRPLRLPRVAPYDAAVSLGWLNLPFPRPALLATLARIRRALVPGGLFLFDFFGFRDLVVPPTGAVALPGGLTLVSHAVRDGRRLHRHFLWIAPGRPPAAESAVLVDRSPAEVRRLLEAAGFEIAARDFLELNYPRHFWTARRAR
jgi:SAM-dependent methyltransferase